eukprot:269308-Prorocentrum_minimum.AAC.1
MVYKSSYLIGFVVHLRVVHRPSAEIVALVHPRCDWYIIMVRLVQSHCRTRSRRRRRLWHLCLAGPTPPAQDHQNSRRLIRWSGRSTQVRVDCRCHIASSGCTGGIAAGTIALVVVIPECLFIKSSFQFKNGRMSGDIVIGLGYGPNLGITFP